MARATDKRANRANGHRPGSRNASMRRWPEFPASDPIAVGAGRRPRSPAPAHRPAHRRWSIVGQRRCDAAQAPGSLNRPQRSNGMAAAASNAAAILIGVKGSFGHNDGNQTQRIRARVAHGGGGGDRRAAPTPTDEKVGHHGCRPEVRGPHPSSRASCSRGDPATPGAASSWPGPAFVTRYGEAGYGERRAGGARTPCASWMLSSPPMPRGAGQRLAKAENRPAGRAPRPRQVPPARPVMIGTPHRAPHRGGRPASPRRPRTTEAAAAPTARVGGG